MESQGAVRPQHQYSHLGVRNVFIRDLVIPALIGVHTHERDGTQRIRINIELAVPEEDKLVQDRLSDVVCYEKIIDGIRMIVDGGHINLVETLAEKIATWVLTDQRIGRARVRVEKLDIFSDASSVGVEIERSNHE